MGYSFRLTARVLLYAPSHRQDSTYHGLCYTSRRPIAPWANALTTELHLAPLYHGVEVLVPPWTSTWGSASLAPLELGVARRGHHREDTIARTPPLVWALTDCCVLWNVLFSSATRAWRCSARTPPLVWALTDCRVLWNVLFSSATRAWRCSARTPPLVWALTDCCVLWNVLFSSATRAWRCSARTPPLVWALTDCRVLWNVLFSSATRAWRCSARTPPLVWALTDCRVLWNVMFSSATRAWRCSARTPPLVWALTDCRVLWNVMFSSGTRWLFDFSCASNLSMAFFQFVNPLATKDSSPPMVSSDSFFRFAVMHTWHRTPPVFESKCNQW